MTKIIGATPAKEAKKATPKKAPVVVPDLVDDNLITVEVKDCKGNLLGTMTAQKRTFSTGSKGYFMSGKIPGIGDDRLQVSGNFVIIGSKAVQ